jgi:formamidopyrimidine-DNA glycosylase
VVIVSIELPEAQIFAKQMNDVLGGKKVKSYDLRDVERMIKIGFLNRDISDFDDLIGRTVLDVASRGNTIRVKFDEGMNILIGPEYGGLIRYHEGGEKVPKYHLRLDFTDGSKLTTRITSMGLIYAVRDENLDQSYMYQRDFLGGISPISEEFTFERFYELVHDKNKQIKPLLVGKEAQLVGLSNAAYQDIIYRAGIHPKRRASELSRDELRALYEAIRLVMEERLRLGGKDQFTDLYGNPGGYTPAMGPNMKGRNCPKCGTPIEKLAHGGGHVYLCPKCQKQ